MKRAAIILVVAILAGLSGRFIDVPKLAGGFKGDVATYVEMTFSIADDFDLKYERRDLLRFHNLYGGGPEGVFLKKTSRSTPSSLEYAKAAAYPIFAAPFAKLGGLGGMFMFNVLLLVGCAWCAALFAAARVGSTWGWAIGFFFIAASSVPVWALALVPEVFNFSLVFFALFLWLYKEVRSPGRTREGDFLGSAWSDIAAAALIGLAAFSKPTNAAPLAPFLAYALWKRAPKRALVIAAAFVAVVGLGFAATKVVTGQFNYQGGARKTFYGAFPFDANGSTFENAKNSKGVVTGGEKEIEISDEILFPGHPHFWQMLGNNAGYFLWGRDAGLIPYFFPGALLLVLWLARIRRTEFWQLCLFVAAAGTAVFMIFWWPYTWNGAGGPVGNRYFLSIYPLLLFLLPKDTGAWTAIASGFGGVAFLWPVFAHPFLATREPWLHPATAPLRLLPVERTMMNDIPERLQGERHKIPIGDPRSFLYRMDANAYNLEDFTEGVGFWLAADASAEVIVANSWPATHLKLLVVNDREANTFKANWGGSKCRLDLKPGERATCDLDTTDSVWAHDSYFYSLKMSTTAGFAPPAPDTRPSLSVKVFPVFSEK